MTKKKTRNTRSRVTRALSILLVLLLIFQGSGTFVYAGFDTWQCGDEEVPYFVCETCGECHDLDEEAACICSVCGDDMTYCESCFCDSCERCEEHCICGETDDEAVDYSGDELELPSVDADMTKAEAAATRELPEIPSFAKLELDKDKKYPKETWRLFEPLCKKSDEESCIAALKSELPTYLQINLLDSANVQKTGTSNLQIGYIRDMSKNAKVREIISQMDWSKKQNVSYEKKVSQIKDLVNALKEQAIASGLDPDWVNSIKVAKKKPSFKNAVMELIVSDDDDAVWEIRINPDMVKKSNDANYIAQAVVHEFQHGVNHIYAYSVNEPGTWEVKLTQNATAAQIRQHISDFNYVSPNQELYKQHKEDEYVISMISYLAQLEERTANEAEYEIHKQFRPETVHPSQFIYERYGYEILPVAMSYINAQKYDEKSTHYLDKMAAAVPELGLIRCDTPFSHLKLLPNDEALASLNSNGKSGTDLLFRVEIDGKETILPSRNFFDWVTEKSGKEPFDWNEMVKKLGPQKESSTFRKTVGEIPHITYYPDNALTMEHIPAEVILFLDSIEAGLRLSEEMEENGKSIDDTLQALNRSLSAIRKEMEDYDTLEILLDDLETLSDDAEELQSDIEDRQAEYEELADELQDRYEELQQELSDYADELNQLMADAVSDPDDEMSAEDIAELRETYRSDYEERANDLQSELEEMADELETLAGEMESFADELDAICSEMEDKSEEAEELSEELEVLSAKEAEIQAEIDALEDMLSSGEAADSLQRTYDRMVMVTAVDEEGSPVVGLPIYYRSPGGLQRFAGNTNGEGKLTVAVNAKEYFGWTVSAGPSGSTPRDAEGYLYAPCEISDVYLSAEVYEDEIVFALVGELELFFTEEEIAPSRELNGGLRVTIRQTPDAEATVRVNSSKIDDAPSRKVAWQEYYDMQFQKDNEYTDGMCTKRYWKSEMTAGKSSYFGAFLLPLGSGSDLPKTSLGRYSQALYHMENGKPVINLLMSDDFAGGQNESPYRSYAFEFSDIPEGRYELAILLPLGLTHFEEIEIVAGQVKKISAEEWTTTGCEIKKEKSIRRVSLDSGIYDLSGKQIEKLKKENADRAPLFGMAVDAAGKTLWSVLGWTEKGELSVPITTTCVLTGNEKQVDSRQVWCSGRIYLFTYHLEELITLLPVNYEYLYVLQRYLNEKTGVERDVKHYAECDGGKIFGVSFAQAEKQKPVYVAFWEQYTDRNGAILMRTAKGQIDFELRYPVTDEMLSKTWMTSRDVRLCLPEMESMDGAWSGHLSSRVFAGTGPSYSFRYSRQTKNLLGNYDENDPLGSLGAIRINTNDGVWLPKNPVGGLTGTATLMRSEMIGEERLATRLSVEAQVMDTPQGTILYFVFEGGCSGAKHEYELTGDTGSCTEKGEVTYTCKNCGEKKKYETEPLGHLKAGEAGEDYYYQIGNILHARYCLRCGMLVDVEAHHYKETGKVTEGCYTTVTSECTKCHAVTSTRHCHQNHLTVDSLSPYGEYMYDSERHWQICEECGEVIEEEHDFQDAEHMSKKCTVCGFQTKGIMAASVLFTANVNFLCPHEEIQVRFNEKSGIFGNNYRQNGSSRMEWYIMSRGRKTILATDTDHFLLEDPEQLELFNSGKVDWNMLHFIIVVGDNTYELQFPYSRPLFEIPELSSTCNEQGHRAYYACCCGKACNADGSAMKDYLLDYADHTYGYDCDEFCDVCGEWEKKKHTMSDTWMYYGENHFRQCKNCQKIEDFGLCGLSDWIIDVKATCGTDGKQHKECPVCGLVKITEVIPKHHSYSSSVVRKPSCQEEGQEELVCQFCGDTQTNSLSKETHTLMCIPPSEGFTEEGVNIGAHYVCKECGEKTMDRKGRITVEEYVRNNAETPLEPTDPIRPERGRANKPSFLWWAIPASLIVIAGAVILILRMKKKKEKTP